jgi:hypothetical protein
MADEPAPTTPADPTPAKPEPPVEPEVFTRPEDKAGLEALRTEREARTAAEREARAKDRRIEELEREKLSETEQLKADAERGRTLAETATGRLREANLLIALQGEGIVGPKAKAAVRLLDKVEYDEAEEPTNLKNALKAAKALYGDDLFVVAAPASDDGGTGQHDHPDLHGGSRPRATDADEDKQFAAYMQANFPQMRQPVQSPNGPS